MTKQTQQIIIPQGIGPEEIAVLEKAGIIPKNTPPAQVSVFERVCVERGLSPFSGEIHLVGYGGKYTRIVGIQGYRKIAGETGLHAGTDDAKFNLRSDGKFNSAAELTAKGEKPKSATVTVYKIIGNQRVPFTHTCLFKEFSSGKQKWASMPFQMIAKCAEAFALRKAFPSRLSGLHIPEEQAAFEDDTITVRGEVVSGNEMEDIKNSISGCKTILDLQDLLAENPLWRDDEDITVLLSERKNEIYAQIEEKVNEKLTKEALSELWSLRTEWHSNDYIKGLFTARKKEIEA